MGRPRLPKDDGLFRHCGFQMSYPDYIALNEAVGRSRKHLTSSEFIRAAITHYIKSEAL